MSQWINNEAGPDCICESPTIVKTTPNGAMLMCLFHTSEAGCYFRLPKKRPDDWPWPIERVLPAPQETEPQQ